MCRGRCRRRQATGRRGGVERFAKRVECCGTTGQRGAIVSEQRCDRREVSEGDQFKFKLNKGDGQPSKNSEAWPPENFIALVDGVENQLRELGQKIFSGTAAVDPYRKGKSTPCEHCDYRAICRIDEWTHDYRSLREPEDKETV